MAAGAATPAKPPLAGTHWQLHAFHSSDDAQGTTKVADPAKFTLHLKPDGQASFQLDCNRGMGSWKIESAGPDSGQLNFGPIATTRAQCPPPHLGERVARDMGHVRSYLLKEGKLFMSLMADAGIYEWHPVPSTTDPERTVRQVQFAKGASSATLTGRIQGYRYIDYQLRALAGQRLTALLKGSNGMNYFNVLPPGSESEAMFVGSTSGDQFDGVLPDDGVYTLRVYLMRAGARRNESSHFSLTVGITGAALKPVPAKVDAVIPGTPFHARTTASCAPAYTDVRECEAFVTRRGFDGTATVVMRWEERGQRRILFVQGQPMAADTFQEMTSTRHERGWTVRFGTAETFEVPEALVFGG